MSMNRFNTDTPMRQREGSLLSPVNYDDDAASLHSRSDQDSDSEDDQLQQAARNSRELRAHDRIVLVEEEDIDRLVTDSRRKQERERRGSGLAVPNPLNLFRRPSLSALSATSSVEDLRAEKRSKRRSRRQRKKEALMERAEHGEDGGLMYELEEGGIKDGSTTGDSSDRDDSDEMDRRHLGLMAQEHLQRRRSWRRWLLIHVLIGIGFTILLLVAWKLSKARQHGGVAVKDRFVSNGTALFGPTTLVISLDGFRADFLSRGLTPRLSAFVKEGISPKYMLPSFPSVTFPNHYTLATGLYPEAHGVVGNTFWDPELKAEFYYTDPQRSLDPKWWGGEPFWATAEKQGVRSAVHMWPGSEAHILNIEPSVMDKYNGDEQLDNKVTRIMDFLDMPGKEDESADPAHWRPQLIAAYVPDVDADGHKYGPNSTEIRTTIQAVDMMMDKIFQGLEVRNLTDIVNVVVVSDHGMATTDRTRLLQLEDLVDTSKIEHVDGWPLMGLRPKNPQDTQSLYDELKEKQKTTPSIEVYMRDVDMPERYHFSQNERIAPLWIVPKTGWAIVQKHEFDLAKVAEDEVYHPRGLHGYDHEHPLMRAIFIARGPAFPHPANSEMEPFQNIELYNLLCDSVGITPQPNNGTLRLPLQPIGTHTDEVAEVQDPLPTEPITESTSSSASTQLTSATEAASPAPTPVEEISAPAEPEGTDQPVAGDGGEGEEPEGKQEHGLLGSLVGAVSGAWDWIAGQAGKVWNDIVGDS
ncbi:ectonucleotide pyrophosphatase phosphodiesterase family member 1 [Cordyceps militaris]|uniref:Ectonucleotide pyrophosphatase phosphodiesterase family member 1 n=1 Tax=Cordyceps militaris TaxID=73501 RepID=A0A2H4SEA1_CORMI|nr:ectonucleotide pyrophosphatase phosphodiesterase family member 1 [Cordyceps militaris]